MLFSSDRSRMRRAFADAWRKRTRGEALEPLERAIAAVVAAHPEYHRHVEDDAGLERDFLPESGEANPFLHMSMHLALREQRGTDRPQGIAAAMAALERRLGDAHAAEHAAMECLGRALWEAQRSGAPPDERVFLACVEALVRGR